MPQSSPPSPNNKVPTENEWCACMCRVDVSVHLGDRCEREIENVAKDDIDIEKERKSRHTLNTIRLTFFHG